MLIKCWECGKEISDLVESCPHCGYPLKSEKESGKYILSKKDENYISNPNISHIKKVGYLLEKNFPKYLAMDLAQKYHFECDPEAKQRYEAVKTREKQRAQQSQQQANIPKCPTCGSTNLSKISGMKKAAKVGFFGIFGAGDLGKTWKCNNCGCKF